MELKRILNNNGFIILINIKNRLPYMQLRPYIKKRMR